MAQIVFGFGLSHSPMLGTDPEQWYLRALEDMNFPDHPFRGHVYQYEELVALRREERVAEQLGSVVWHERHRRSQRQLDLLRNRISEMKLDVLVVFGDDQHEVFREDITPAFLVYTGDTVLNKAVDAERLKEVPPGVAAAAESYHPAALDVEYPGAPELAYHIVVELMGAGFDVAVSEHMPADSRGERSIPHAFGFVYHRVLDDLRVTPNLATVPVFINTFFPPNRPSTRRVLDFGKAIGQAIRSWPSRKRVGIAASGGFSHFVIDEDLDRRLLRALAAGDEQALTAEPELECQSGTSEIKNWIAAFGAVSGSGLRFQLLDYVPCYRTPAGTGNANTFGVWVE
ncbi:MAG: protocatechuate 3,4-dioxygenase [Gammaproteobacteria bacterium]|nr:protocatechuate 3,4-dioxygenase [Gammaproteobacteria bacterium]